MDGQTCINQSTQEMMGILFYFLLLLAGDIESFSGSIEYPFPVYRVRITRRLNSTMVVMPGLNCFNVHHEKNKYPSLNTIQDTSPLRERCGNFSKIFSRAAYLKTCCKCGSCFLHRCAVLLNV